MQTIEEVKKYCREVGEGIVGYAFDRETREAMREFFDTAYWC